MKRHVKACHLKQPPRLLLIANYLCALSHQRSHNQEKRKFVSTEDGCRCECAYTLLRLITKQLNRFSRAHIMCPARQQVANIGTGLRYTKLIGTPAVGVKLMLVSMLLPLRNIQPIATSAQPSNSRLIPTYRPTSHRDLSISCDASGALFHEALSRQTGSMIWGCLTDAFPPPAHAGWW